MEITNRRKKTGWRLNKKGKRNIEFIVITIIGVATIGYIMGGSWLLYAIMTSGVTM